MANKITILRIVCSIVLIFCPVFSVPFYVLYITAGITDMIDGTVARKTNTVSEFGSRLDTIADFIFVIVCLMKLLPVLKIEAWIYIWIVLIAIVKVINIISGYVMHKKFVSVHSHMNKLTGALLFLLPLTLRMIDLKYSVVAIGIIATFAAIQEGHYIRMNRDVKEI